MPHSISNAAAPVTKGAAIEVPLFTVIPPSLDADTIFTAGATMSGFTILYSLVYPLPEKIAMLSSLPL